MDISEAYSRQLVQKKDLLQSLLSGIDFPEPAVFDSPPQHYRLRAEFRIWQDNGSCSYAMFRPGEKPTAASVILLETFDAADDSICRLMPELMAKIRTTPVLQGRLFQADFLSSLAGDMLVTLIYHKELDAVWQDAARKAAGELGIGIIGRSRGQKVVLDRDYVVEKLNVGGETFVYKQPEGSFTQPNARVCEKMLAWAADAAGSNTDDLLELYCGNGNFTMPLSRRFRRVLATEISKTAVAAALWNVTQNKADNIAFARLSAEEFSEAYRGERTFRRLEEQGIDLSAYRFSTVLVDPPRAGIDDATLALLQQFDRIIYISCNPHSLRANLDTLLTSHRIAKLALFDQFPFTEHIECGVLLEKKPG